MEDFPTREASRVRLIDATLREGCQAPDVAFSLDDNLRIAAALLEVGADMIECGHPSASAFETERVAAIVGLVGRERVLTHARATVTDVAKAAAAGAGWVGIFAGVNPMTARTRILGVTPATVHAMATEAIAAAKERGLGVRFTVEDGSRTETALLLDTMGVAVDAGADRLCYADTVGGDEPAHVRERVAAIVDAFPGVAIELHLHDDRGLALANALAGIDAGAQWVSCSVNGLGERAGIVDTCALLANLHARGTRPLAGRMTLRRLSRTVELRSGSMVDARRPVTGRNVFVHTAGLHIRAIERDEMAYSWIAPAVVGGLTAVADRTLGRAGRHVPALERAHRGVAEDPAARSLTWRPRHRP
jgi:2-isopropylmalate synthase